MQEPIVIAAVLLSLAIVLATLIVVFGRLKIEQQKTLQKLLEKGESSRRDWDRILAPVSQPVSDFRRGVLLTVVGLALTGFLFLVGGIGWLLGLIPTVIGLVYLLFWRTARSGHAGRE